MKIFITGGAGFIGSHVVDLLSKQHAVTVYDNMNSAVRKNAPNPNVTIIQGDIRDTELLTHSMKHHDAVLAFAVAHIRLSINNPLEVHDINGTGNLITLQAAKKNKIKRFVYISSSEIYGSAINTKMQEDHEINPTTIYGASKYVGELYTNQFGRFEGLETTVIRPFNTYGPRSHFDGYYGEVIPRMTIRILNGEAPLIFGDGTNTRDFTYVTDTAKGIVDTLFSPLTVHQTLNIAFGKEVSVNTIANILCKELNPDLKPVYKPSRPNDVKRHAADTKKAKKLIHWNPTVSIEKGIKQYVSWFKKTYPDVNALRALVPDTNW